MTSWTKKLRFILFRPEKDIYPEASDQKHAGHRFLRKQVLG
jgi:hypothetical protein